MTVWLIVTLYESFMCRQICTNLGMCVYIIMYIIGIFSNQLFPMSSTHERLVFEKNDNSRLILSVICLGSLIFKHQKQHVGSNLVMSFCLTDLRGKTP